ncbi:MAG TPA: GNAT family N-acetyltransferase [Symbiobacteriaceae bacterium]|nr:GNAT family N-acetyltransferase [Symbiobacteriaceae bacterium]
MQYRAIQPDEIEQLKRAEEYCFFIPPEDNEPWMDRKVRPEYLLGAFGDDGVMKAGLTNFPFQLYIGGAKLGMGGIAGVVSWPEYRREGNVGELLIRLLHQEREKGVPLSGLFPFKQSFYRRFGWEVSAAWLMTDIPIDGLAQYRRSEGFIRHFAPGQADWRSLETLYAARFASRFGAMVRETEHHWVNWVLVDWSRWGRWHTAVWSTGPAAEPEGYLLYKFNKDEKTNQQQILIKELVALTPAAERGLWGFIAQHDSQVAVAQIRTRRDYPLWHLVENTREVKSTLQSGWMLRFVDMLAAFETRPWPGAPEASFAIGAVDEHLPWNSGTFRLRIEAERCTLTPAPAETAALAADQRTWAQLYAGFIQPEQAVMTGRMTCTDEKALKALSAALAGKEMWFYEYF